MDYSISEVAEMTGLTAHTLRWYERVGLVATVDRDGGGRRRYTARDLEWLNLLIRLRATGMPIAEMARYAELARQGELTYPERERLLVEHRGRVLAAIEEQRAMLELLDHKITIYRSGGQCMHVAPPDGEAFDAQGEARGA